jgi:hypothetical protein
MERHRWIHSLWLTVKLLQKRVVEGSYMEWKLLEVHLFHCMLRDIEQNLLVHADRRPHGHRAENGNGIVHQCYKVRTVWA